MKIKVLQKDIDKAKRVVETYRYEHCTVCAISQAIRRITKKKVSIGYKYCNIGNKTYDSIPKIAVDFMRKFDDKKKVNPFEFELTK